MTTFLSRLAVALAAAAMLTGCATMGPPQPPSLELPKPPLDLRAARKGSHVVLTWTVPVLTTDRQTIRSVGSTRICRGNLPLQQCGTPVGEVVPIAMNGDRPKGKKTPATFTDTLPADMMSADPAAEISYAIEADNAGGRAAGLSNRARVLAVATVPPPEVSASVTAQGIVLHWTRVLQEPEAADAAVRHRTRIYRRAEGATGGVLVEETTADANEIVDHGMEWQKTYFYRATVVTVVAAASASPCETKKAGAGCVAHEVEGDDSPEIKVVANDVFSPAVPSGLQAVFSGPGQQPFIDLIWGPVTDLDLDGYFVYGHEEGSAAVRLNKDPVKSPAYRDTSVAVGRKYFYSVSSVDVRGNESARSEEASETGR